MATTLHNRVSLSFRTVDQLREIARSYNIPGMRKARKNDIIDAILRAQPAAGVETSAPRPVNSDRLVAVEGTFTTTMNDRSPVTTTTIRVSCGANSERFPVVGRKVEEVSEILREILNVDRMAEGVVNGRVVDGSYVLTANDTLEFLKPAGRKG